MPNRIVLIPFSEAASAEHLLSTRGGNVEPHTEQTFTQIATLYEQWKKNPNTNPEVLKKAKQTYDKAAENVRNATRPSWKKIDPQNVVCRNSPLLAAALQKLTAVDDTLYIRGHCEAGGEILQSSDRNEKIDVDGLFKILNGKLDKKFPGKIKIFACESSVDVFLWDSFAKRFAIKLSKEGWINCSFYGYKEKLNTYIRDDVSGHKTTQRGTQASASRQLIQVPTNHGWWS